MSYETFGSETDIFKILGDFIDSIHKNKIKFSDATHRQMIFRELYQKVYNIHPESKGSVLDLVSMSPKEGHWRSGPIPIAIDRYRMAKIYDKFHLTLPEFFDLEKPIAEYLIEVGLHESVKEADSKSNTLRQLDLLTESLTNLSPEQRAIVMERMNKKNQ